jgi:hypothetical protein
MLYTVFNAAQKVLNLPRTITENIRSQGSNEVNENTQENTVALEEPKNNEHTAETSPSESVQLPALNIAECFSKEVLTEFKDGYRSEIDWLDEAIQKSGKDQRFSTVVRKSADSKASMDLLKLKITNDPQSLKSSIVSQWPLLQKYEKDEILTWSRNPYWFVKAKANVMQGHNGIWNKNVGCLLLAVMATEPVTIEFIKDNKPNQQEDQEKVSHTDVLEPKIPTDE